MSPSCKISIMVLGEMNVGKTSLLLQFNKGKFIAYNSSTSINRYFRTIRVMDTDIELELYDTGGHDRFRDIVKANYKKVEGVLLIYDVTDVSSFYKLSNWLAEFRSENEKAAIIIVGNKSDTPDIKAVSRTMVKAYASKENLEYYKGSAKTGENIKQIFERIVQKVLEAKKGLSYPKHTESLQSDHSSQSTDSAISNPSNQSTKILPELPQPLINSENISVTSTQPTESSTKHSIESDSSPKQLTDSVTIDEADWCFPDLEYLNSRSRNSIGLDSQPKSDDLPPIVPLPDDIIMLHTEKYRDETMNPNNERKKKSSCFNLKAI